MEWLQDNWLFILFVLAVFAMHMFGHGGHGHHGHRRNAERHTHDAGRDEGRNASGDDTRFPASQGEAGPWQQG